MPEDGTARQAVGARGFDLAFGDGEEAATEGFGHVGTHDEADDEDAGGERVHVEMRPAEFFGEGVQQVLAAVVDEEELDEVRYATDEGGVGECRGAQPRVFAHFAEAGEQAEGERDEQAAQGKLKGDERTLEQDFAVFQQDGKAVHRLFRRAAGDVVLEVFVVHFFVRAVFFDGFQRGVQVFAQLVVVFAHAHRDARAEVFGVAGFARDFKAFTFVATEEAVFHHDFVGKEQVHPSGDGGGVGVFLRGEALDVGVGEFGGGVVVEDGGAQHADDFALDAFRGRLNFAAFGAHEQAGVAVIGVSEGDALAAFRSIVHRGEDDVDFFGLQRRD